MDPQLNKYINSLKLKQGVRYAEIDNEKLTCNESIYLAIRKLENRIYSDQELITLPYLKNHMHSAEWKLRAKSATRILNYFKKKQQGMIMDLGCGNGWFSNLLASAGSFQVLGLDINRLELEQAGAVFSSNQVSFICGDVFEMDIPFSTFDCIAVGAAIQYFGNLRSIVDRLMKLIKKGGEIHIFDSPFYPPSEIEMARNRSYEYYRKLGFSAMAENYFHHSTKDLNMFNVDYMYSPTKKGLIGKLTGNRDIPFPWIKIMIP